MLPQQIVKRWPTFSKRLNSQLDVYWLNGGFELHFEQLHPNKQIISKR
jgi:cobyrinic acid a,c-diamide synthase